MAIENGTLNQTANDASDKLITLDNLAVFQEEIDARKQDTLPSGSDGQYLSLENGGMTWKNIPESVPLTSITYANLKALRDGGTLVSGRQYRITDYQCTTTQSNTSSAGHAFDIIVTADSANKLNEIARACLHSGDTYFANSKLEAWQLWYCLDNDTTRFAWADSANGKGVVYRMIDEFNNDVPYDFKNILFTFSGKYTNAYTFTYTENSTIKDASLLGLSKKCYDNIVKEYIVSSKRQLNFNVFYSTNTSFSCYYNRFEEGCYNNTFAYNCHSNTFGSNCYYNTFGDSCNYNTFGDSCYTNTFGNGCYSNTFGDSCRYNTFGNSCNFNTFGDDCYYIIFGNSSSTINYCQYIIVDSGCSYIYLNSTDTSASLMNYLQNVHIHLGVKGTSSSRKTITIPDRNLSYETNVYMDVNRNIEQIVNGGIIPAINADY